MSTKRDYLFLSTKLLNDTHRLASGPNKNLSSFGRIIEGSFRKGYFTLQTIVSLADQIKKDEQLRIVYASSILDLSRRVLEDMLYMEYINEKGKEEYTKQFIDFESVEKKNDMEFILGQGGSVDEEIQEEINGRFERLPRKLKKRKNWSGQSFEEIVEWFLQNTNFKQWEKEILLKVYNSGNRKNHTSPTDIIDHLDQEWISDSSINDLEIGLMITYVSLIKIGLIARKELEFPEETKKSIEKHWKGIGGSL